MSSTQASASGGRAFMNSASGRWAGEQLLAAMKAGRPVNASELRTCDTLRKDEWKAFDEAVIEEGIIRLRGVADLMGAGLTIPVANALGKTLFEYEDVTDMEAAVVSLDGLARGDSDRQVYSLSSLPLPITHKDFNISIRTLAASRERGEALDTTQVRTAGRLVAEKLEALLFLGGPTFGASVIRGYTDHPDRNTGGFGAGTWSASARTGAEVLTDVFTMRDAAEADRFYGPFWIYVSANMSSKMEEDYRSNDDRTIRDRILNVAGVERVTVVDQLTADNVIMVQATRDVVVLVDGEGPQTIQWDIYGGMAVAFKVFAIQVPLIRSDAQQRSGVFHMS